MIVARGVPALAIEVAVMLAAASGRAGEVDNLGRHVEVAVDSPGLIRVPV
jgi:hypothetical protein